MREYHLPNHINSYYIGPALTDGPVPTCFYFVATAKESLMQEPFSTPAEELAKSCVRVFSIDLPLHSKDQDSRNGMHRWASELAKNRDIFTPFINECCEVIHSLIQNQSTRGPILLAGLSRGGFIATHIAATLTSESILLAYAPVTDLGQLIDFHNIAKSPIVQNFKLSAQIPNLIHKSLRFHIGNHDTIVNTHECISFIEELVKKTYDTKPRICPVELVLTPSIGYGGHGTSPESFFGGIRWLKELLKNKFNIHFDR